MAEHLCCVYNANHVILPWELHVNAGSKNCVFNNRNRLLKYLTRQNWGVSWGLDKKGCWMLRAIEGFGRTESKVCHAAQTCCPEQGSWDPYKGKSDSFSHAQTSKQTSHLPSSPSALWALTCLSTPDPAEVSAHPQHPQPCLFPPSSQAVPAGYAHTHRGSSDPLLFFPWVSSNVPAKYESRAMIS